MRIAVFHKIAEFACFLYVWGVPSHEAYEKNKLKKKKKKIILRPSAFFIPATWPADDTRARPLHLTCSLGFRF